MTDDDVRRTVGYCTQLCARGGTVVWTRGRWEPDLVPQICDWFAGRGFELGWVSDPAQGWGAGAHRFTAAPVVLERGARMFTFSGHHPRTGPDRERSLTEFDPERTGLRAPRTAKTGSAGPSARPVPCGFSAIHAAIWARELKPNLAMMLATCLAAVVGLMESSPAMALLLRPLATRVAIWCSRWVSELGGAEATW